MLRILALTAVLGWCLTSMAASEAGETRLPGGGTFSVPVKSYTERFFDTVVRQQYDFSCGSAAVATLLTYHYDRPTTEAEVIEAMFEVGDQDKVSRVGFSFLDVKKYLASIGLSADGFKVPLDQVAATGVPAITLIEIEGYRHFVVIKGVTEDSVLVGDPALGLKEFDRDEFEKLRVNDIVFVIRDELEVAQEHFNLVEEWRLRRPRGPLAEGLDRQSVGRHGALTRTPIQMRPLGIDAGPPALR